jgi:GTP-binding protein
MVTSLEWSKYVGRIATGRISAGRIRTGQQIALLRGDGTKVLSKVDQVQLYDNLGRTDAAEAFAGDIVAVIGIPDPEIGIRLLIRPTLLHWNVSPLMNRHFR